MKFHQVTVQQFPEGGTQLDFAFGVEEVKGEHLNAKSGFYVTAGFPGGWNQQQVAEQLRKLADHLERAVNKQEQQA